MQTIGGMTLEDAFILGLQDCQFLFEFSILPAASLRPLTQTDRASRHSHDRASIRCAPGRPAPRPSGEHQVDEEEELVINPSTTSIRSAPGLLTNINPSTRSIRSSTLTSFLSPPTSIPAALCKATTARHTEKSPDSPSKL